MILGDVMDEVAARLDDIDGLRVYAWPPGSIDAPAAIVSYPMSYQPNETYGRGMAVLELPVVIAAGAPTERQTRDALTAYCDGSGPSSVTALMARKGWVSCDSVRVARWDFDSYPFGDVEYMMAIAVLEIVGKGF